VLFDLLSENNNDFQTNNKILYKMFFLMMKGSTVLSVFFHGSWSALDMNSCRIFKKRVYEWLFGAAVFDRSLKK
jgi:hypothetical protein